MCVHISASGAAELGWLFKYAFKKGEHRWEVRCSNWLHRNLTYKDYFEVTSQWQDGTGACHTHISTTSAIAALMASVVVNFQAVTRVPVELLQRAKMQQQKKGTKAKTWQRGGKSAPGILSALTTTTVTKARQSHGVDFTSAEHIWQQGFQQHTDSVWVKWRLYWAWLLGSDPASLWKWDEPIQD